MPPEEDAEDITVSVQESASLSNPFGALDELSTSREAQTPMEAPETKALRKRRPSKKLLPITPPNDAEERPTKLLDDAALLR